MLRLGVIGYGTRINAIVGLLLETGKVKLSAIADINTDAVRERFGKEKDFSDVKFYSDAEEMLKSEKLDGVCVGTRCSTHARMGALVAKYNVPLFLEKPVAINNDDIALLESSLSINDKTVVSFPLRICAVTERVKQLITDGYIGEVTHVEAVNNVTYGRGYYHKWYRDDKETGGLFLQKATHDIDYINFILDWKKPVRVCAMKSKQYFKGDKPAGLKCKDCPDQKTCPESPENIIKGNSKKDLHSLGEYCCFAVDTGNEDSGTMIVEYENGMHVVYTQDFVVRNGAAKRGAIIVGEIGTIEFDLVTGDITYYKHTEDLTQKIEVETTTNDHYGGDRFLVENFVEVMEGSSRSKANLAQGILSAKICLAATESSEKYEFITLK